VQTFPDREQLEQNVDVDVAPVEPATTAPSETIHNVLAAQARERTTLELSAGALVGSANAALIWMRFPSLHWLAAGFAATAWYGVWGLVDRRLTELNESAENKRISQMLMRISRPLAGALGWAAALFAMIAFLTAGIATIGFPGG
jgi:hypothetical protein